MEPLDLNRKEISIAEISAFTAKGDLVRLKPVLNEGLDAGLTVNEIKEVLVQMYAYAGFPRSLNGLGCFMDVVEDRQRKGIKDEVGKEASPLPADKSRLELGTETQKTLVGVNPSGGVMAFAPAIDLYLKEHLFGDIFGRDVLDYQTREIATISALAAMEGVTPQLEAHLKIGFNVGLSESQLRSLVSVIAAQVDKAEGDKAVDALERVLAARKKETLR